MKKAFLFLAFLFIFGGVFCVPARASWTYKHTVVGSTCNTSSTGGTCTVAVTSTGGGDVGVCWGWTNSTTIQLSSCSGGGTWYTPTSPACGSTGGTGSWFCAYNLNLTAATTTITCTFSNSATHTVACGFTEASFTKTSVALDVAGGRTVSSAAANLAGTALTLTGTSDLVVAGMYPSGTASACATPFNTNGIFTNGVATCYAVNVTASATMPSTYTVTSSTAGMGAIAIKEFNTLVPQVGAFLPGP